MPTIVRFATCVIRIFFDDHNPPHFHVQGKDFAAVIEIETLRVLQLRGKQSDLKEALAWAEENKEKLWSAWDEYSK